MPEIEHAHQYDTNDDWYRCPLSGCWWNDPASHVRAACYRDEGAGTPPESQRLNGCTCIPVRGAHKPPCAWSAR